MTRATLGGMFPARAKELGYLETLGKFAASRLDKEVAAGRARYEDVLPARHIPPGASQEDLKRISRAYSHTPAFNPSIARHRDMNARLFAAQTARPEALVGPGVTVSTPKTRAPGTILPFSGHDLRTAPLHVEVSPRSGQFYRMMADTFDPELAERTLARAPSRLPAAHPMDATLNLSALQHEFGEVEALRKNTTMPHASHAGIEPLLRERLAVRHDPEAHYALEQMRGINQFVGVPDDDLLFTRLHKQVGGTGNTPVQPGTRRARALEQRMRAAVPQMLPETRREHVLDQLNALSGVAGTDRAPQRVGALPDELYDALTRAVPTTGEGAIRRGAATDTLRKRLRIQNPELNTLVKRYIAKGRL